MPNYTYHCDKCNITFELFFTIRDYIESPKCPSCKKNKTCRSYKDDMQTISTSIKKLDSELKTIGDLANRNRDKLSDDEKQHLFNKHNEYKDEAFQKPLPKGMDKISKPKKKIKWT